MTTMADEPRIRTDGPPPTSPLEIVTARVEEMISEAELLRTAVAANATAVKSSNRRYHLTIGALALILAALAALTLGNRALSADNERLNQRSLEVLARLDDCLVESKDPDSCYARQQARTGELLGEPSGPINTVTVLTAVCTRIYLDRPTDDVDDGKRRILDCVAAELERRE